MSAKLSLTALPSPFPVIRVKVRSGAIHARCGGYVLLMTLALLVMASTMLVAVGRVAVSHAISANLALSQLQRKWGTRSCRDAILPYAEAILLHVEANANVPAPHARVTIRLTDQTFELDLADEQAKANVNAMLEQQTIGGVEDRLREAFSGTGMGNAIRLRPVFDDVEPTADQSTSAVPPPLRSFGQITTDASYPSLLSGSSPLAGLTLWGSGAINILRASSPAMRLALWPTLSRVQIDRMIAARDKLLSRGRNTQDSQSAGAKSEKPTTLMGYLMNEADVDPKLAARLTVTDRSTCHSLWIIAKDRQRVWYNFSVSDESTKQHPRHDDFVW